MVDRRALLLWSMFATSCLVALPACTFVENLNQFDEGTSSSSGANPACGPFEHPGTSSVADDFNAASLDAAKWFSVGDCAAQTQGEIQVAPLADTTTDYCWIGTNAMLHLACDSVTLKVPGTTAPIGGPQTFLYIEQANAPQIALILEGGSFLFSGDDLTAPGDRDYDSVADLWWRLRESTGTLFFDTAPDGLTWTTRIQIPDPSPLDDVRIDLGAGTHEAVATPGEARFDCFDVPPPCP